MAILMILTFRPSRNVFRIDLGDVQALTCNMAVALVEFAGQKYIRVKRILLEFEEACGY